MTEITAELRNWYKGKFGNEDCYWGEAYADIKKRWPDGRRIATSQIMSEEDMGDHIVVHTRFSVYKLMKDQEKKV